MKFGKQLTVVSAVLSVLFAGPSAPVEAQSGPSGLAYVTNVNSDNVSAYAIDATGALTPAPGSPFATGHNPLGAATDPFGRFVYVPNLIGSTSEFGELSAYAIDATTGALTPLPGSPFQIEPGPKAAVVHPSGRFLYVAFTSGFRHVAAFSIDQGRGR